MIRRLPQQAVRHFKSRGVRLPSSKRIRRFGTSNDQTKKTIPKTFPVTPAQAGAIFLGGALSARFVYNTFLVDPSSDNSGIRRDASKATVLLKSPPTTPPNPLTINEVDEETKELHQVDADNFAKFCRAQRVILQEKREESKQAAKEKLKQELEAAFADCYTRIPQFSKWYFAYTTTWTLWTAAAKSAAKHVVSFTSEQTLAEAVSKDLQVLVCQKYEALVLKPKWTDPKIHKAFVDSLQAAHEDYLKALGELETSVATFVKEETKSVAVAPTTKDVIVDVDWKTQLQKVDHVPTAFEKSSPQFSMALIGTSVVGGKVMGAGSAVTATKALLGKLTSPFVTKAVAATLGKGGSAVATGAGAAGLGAMAGGPLGAAIGAAVGVTVDMTINAGIALMQKGSLEKDVNDAMDVTLLEWQENLWPELERTQGLWFDRADAVLGAKPSGVATTTTSEKLSPSQ